MFNSLDLISFSGKSIQILDVGLPNYNSGPDFFNAKIKIDNQLWAGNVEIHVKSSDWYVHNHEQDSAYSSIILHVVWENDINVFREDSSVIETLELKKYINDKILSSYQKLFTKKETWINCEKNISILNNFLKVLV